MDRTTKMLGERSAYEWAKRTYIMIARQWMRWFGPMTRRRLWAAFSHLQPSTDTQSHSGTIYVIYRDGMV